MKNVIIIGAGPAGITAAYELLKESNEYQVTILEGSNVIGGISQTVRHNGNRMDIGGHRFFSKNETVMKWWFDLLPLQGAPAKDDKLLNRQKEFASVGPDPEATDVVMLLRDRWSRIYYNGHFFDYPVKMNWNTIKNMGIGGTLKAGFSFLGASLSKLPEDNLENFYINRFGKVLYSMFFEGYTEKLWGRHPRDISADWGSQRVKGLSITAIIADIFGKIIPRKNRKVETSLIEQFYYPKFGPGQLWELAAAKTQEMGSELKMNSLVTGLETDDNNIRKVTYKDADGEHQIEADYVFSSMPLNDLTEAFGEKVPTQVKTIGEGLPYRDFVTIGLLVKKLNLENKTNYKTVGNIVPDCWIYVQETSVKVGRIQIFNNWSPYLVADLEDSVWIGLEYFCNEDDDFWMMEKQACIDFAIDELIQMGIISSHDDVLDSHREQIKKAYPAYFDTYDHIDELRGFLDNYENLYCIGRNGQHRYNNMDHSMLTSMEAVKLMLTDNTDKSSLWQINADDEYHEEKK